LKNTRLQISKGFAKASHMPYIPPSSTEGRLDFPAQPIRFEAVTEVLMLIRIRPPDKYSASTQRFDIMMFIHQARHYRQASYTALEAIFGVLYGST
jgi:hypothetical protein